MRSEDRAKSPGEEVLISKYQSAQSACTHLVVGFGWFLSVLGFFVCFVLVLFFSSWCFSQG